MKKRFILLILSVLFVSSCDDFFYPDLIDGSYIYGISDCDCKSIDTVEVVEVIENDYTKAYTKPHHLSELSMLAMKKVSIKL